MIVHHFLKKYLMGIPLSLGMLSISGCGGGDFQNLVNELFPDNIEGSNTGIPAPKNISANYKALIKADDLISSSNTSNVSIGIFDNGFNTSHIELANRLVIEQNYDDITVNNDFLSRGNSIAWSWADHGTAVAALALGKNAGIAPQAEAVTSINRSLSDSFDSKEYFQSFTKDETGRFVDSSTGEKICVQYILSSLDPLEERWFPWCVNFEVFHFNKLTEVASFDMPAITLSSTIPFGHYQVGIDLSFNQATWDDDSYISDWDQANLTEFTDLYFYDYNSSYNKIQNLLATNDVVIVLAAGNDNKSLTQELVLDWQALKASSTNSFSQTIINVFFDTEGNIDRNANGVIEDNDKGITKGLLFVGALDSFNKLAWYSNYPGSSVEVQARFVVALGDLSVATPSLGESDYSNKSGTSYAAPLVSGAIALLKANHPSKTAREIANAILATASKDTPGYTIETHGQGLLDVAAADEYLKIN